MAEKLSDRLGTSPVIYRRIICLQTGSQGRLAESKNVSHEEVLQSEVCRVPFADPKSIRFFELKRVSIVSPKTFSMLKSLDLRLQNCHSSLFLLISHPDFEPLRGLPTVLSSGAIPKALLDKMTA